MLIIKIDKPKKQDFLNWFKVLDDLEILYQEFNIIYNKNYRKSYYMLNKDKWKIYKERKQLGITNSTPGRYKEYTEEELKEKRRKRRMEYYYKRKNENKDYQKEYQQNYYKKNKERIKEYQKKYNDKKKRLK